MDLKQLRFSANQIATMLGGRVVGDGAREVWNVAPVEAAAEGDLSYVCDAKYLPQLATTGASVVLLTDSLLAPDTQAAATLICVPNARVAVAQLLGMVSEALNPQPRGIEQPCFIAEGVEVPEDAYIGAFAYIGRGVKLGRGVRIYPHTYIGDYTRVGERTVLYAGVKIYHHCVVGSDCILHSGCVIGADGFGFEPDEKGINRKIPQIGNVVIEDDVEIGANTTIDRAMMGSTLVRRNTKIDNLVQLGHGVQVGESDFLCAQVGVAGSTKIGSHCILAGQVGVAGHLEITDNCILGAQTGVAGSIRQSGAYQGSPHQPAMDWRRSMVGVKQLPQLMREHTQMMRQLSKLENKEDQQ